MLFKHAVTLSMLVLVSCGSHDTLQSKSDDTPHHEKSLQLNHSHCKTDTNEPIEISHAFVDNGKDSYIILFLEGLRYKLHRSPVSNANYLTDQGINKGEGLILYTNKMQMSLHTYNVKKANKGMADYPLYLTCIL